jgi:hypothetical protein
LGLVVFALEYFKKQTGWPISSMMASFYLCLLCGVLLVIGSYVFPEPLKDEAKLLVWEDWREPLRGRAHGRGLGNYRVLAAAVLATFIVLYIVFR